MVLDNEKIPMFSLVSKERRRTIKSLAHATASNFNFEEAF